MMNMGKFLLWMAIVAVLVSGQQVVAAQEYRIGPDDLLEIRFWQDPTLNATVRVSQEGTISLDIIGRIKAAGLTTTQLENEVVRQMSRLNSRISQAVVRVLEYQYQHVFVKGQVMAPGKLSFEEIPDLWTIINEAGGITEFGDLSRVTIIRGGDAAGKIEVVNVLEALESGDLSKLPKISRQDTIEIPRTPAGIPSPDISQQLTRKNLIFVIGAVNTPGPIQFQEDVDLMEALALAGGPAPDADLKKVKIVSSDGYYAQAMEVNLEKYAKTGTPSRYILKKEDTFLIPRRGGGFLGMSLGTAATVIGIVSSAIIIYDRLSTDNGTTTTAP